MEQVDCPICHGATEGREARIAPFLSKYCNIEDTKTEIRYCAECDFAFFKRRLTDAEATRLYTNYRGEEYNRVRLEVEPSYAKYIPGFNDELSSDHTTRVRDHTDLLDVYPELGDFKNILDFGGDGAIPGRTFRNAKIWIDDLSAGSNDEAGRKHEFIFASNVFEHISDPVAALRKLVERLQPEGLIFIDVPGPLQATLSEGLLWQRRHGGPLYEMHEHINHFSKRSLNRLVRAAGLVPLFEYRARHTAQSVIAAVDGSEIAKKLLPLKEPRRLLFEAKIARALALDASELWHASDKAATRVISTTTGAIDNLANLLREKAHANEMALRQELDSVYQSTSWRITAPIRALKRALSR